MAESINENQLIGGPFVGEIDYNEIEKIMVNFIGIVIDFIKKED